MKSIIKKSVFILFFVLILSFSVLISSAADSSEYAITITAENIGVNVGGSMQLVAEVEDIKLQPVIT